MSHKNAFAGCMFETPATECSEFIVTCNMKAQKITVTHFESFM